MLKKSRSRLETAALVTAGLIALLFVFIGIAYSTRGTPLETVRAFGDPNGPPSVSEPLFRHTMELFTGAALGSGGSVEVLPNGERTYPRLWADLRSATRSITVQMYFYEPGRVADTLKAILTERARAGVRVLFLHDAFGAEELSKDYIDSLRAAGVHDAPFRPVHWYSLHKAQTRSHVRVVVVDGRVGYTGGFGIADKWLGDGHSEDQWRDTNARFTGPAVAQLQAAFAAAWVEATGQLITGDLFFPPQAWQADGAGPLAGLLHMAPTIGSTPAERFLALSIASARKRLYIANSYFVPDDDFRRLLLAAAKRGVDVRVLTTGPKTDVKTTRWAGRSHYEELLKGGVKIYEYMPTMMHAKTLVADDLWSSIGTMDFDNRSLAFNDESNLNVLDPAVGATMDSLFLDDLKYSHEIKLQEFQRRSFVERVLEGWARGISRLL